MAERFSNNGEVSEFLGRELDIAGMLGAARSRNPGLQILNLSDFREERFGGTDFEGRLPGNRGDEYRIQGKLAYQITEKTKLSATYLEDRDQGIVFDRRRIFWTEERNREYVNRNRVGIFGYDRRHYQTSERSFNISIRGSFQRFERHTGDLFAPFDSTSARTTEPGASLGYHDRGSFLNFMWRDIPIFGRDLWAFRFDPWGGFDGVIRADDQRGDNPFGIPTDTFYDQNKGYVDTLFNTVEDRKNLRLDFDGRLNRNHRLKAGVEVKEWQLDSFNNKLSSTVHLDFYGATPNMESIYLEDRMTYENLVIDLGLRLDSFNAARSYPAVFGDQDSGRLEPSRKTVLAPRLGLLHPVTDRIQVRGGFDVRYQVPQFSSLYESINVDVDQQGNTSAFFGNPDLDFQKVTAFEFGFTALLTDDLVFDLAGYNKEYDRSVAARYLIQEGSVRYARIFTNDGFGHARGLDAVLRRRFRDHFSAELAYSLLFSRSTDTDPDDFVSNEGRFVLGNEPVAPPTELFPNDFDQTHTVNAQLNLQLPSDFRKGTVPGSVLRDMGFFFTFQAHSGRPYTRQDTRHFDFIEEGNGSRTGWQSMVNLRVTRNFSISGLDYTVFADIRNLFDTGNLSAHKVDVYAGSGVTNGVYQTSGNPYTDGSTIDDALDYMGLASPEEYVDPSRRTPTDINGDGMRDDMDRAEIIRRLDMDGDGRVTIEEELAMAILSMGAFDANPENFDVPRLVRLGLEVRF